MSVVMVIGQRINTQKAEPEHRRSQLSAVYLYLLYFVDLFCLR